MRKLDKKQRLIIFISLITVIVIIGIIIGVNAIRVNISNGEYNSSNSGSSNGNLLPEYIKAGITLGGVTGTLEDLDTSDATATPEDVAYGKTAYVNGRKIEGVFVPRDNLKIGQYVDYTPDITTTYSLTSAVSGYSSDQTIEQERNLKWQILNINNDGTVDLVSNIPANQSIYFSGSRGYNNCVYSLNDICSKQYSNSKLGTVGRSIKLEDIDSKLNSEGIAKRNAYISLGNVQYNSVYTNYTYRYYPILYPYENGSGINTTNVKVDGIGQSDSYYTSPTMEEYAQAGNYGLTTTQTYYWLPTTDNKEIFDNTLFYDLIFGNGANYNYWVATRFVDCSSASENITTYNAHFGLHFIKAGAIDGQGLYNSDQYVNIVSSGLRPVVQIPTNVMIYGGDGSEEHPYELTK